MALDKNRIREQVAARTGKLPAQTVSAMSAGYTPPKNTQLNSVGVQRRYADQITARADELDKLNVPSASRLAKQQALITERADELDKWNVPSDTRLERAKLNTPPVSQLIEQSNARIQYNQAKKAVAEDKTRIGDIYSNDETAKAAEQKRREDNEKRLKEAEMLLRRLGLDNEIDPTFLERLGRTTRGTGVSYGAQMAGNAGVAAGLEYEYQRALAEDGANAIGRSREEMGDLRTSQQRVMDAYNQMQQVNAMTDELNLKATQDIERAKQGLGTMGQFAVDFGVAAGQQAIDAMLSGGASAMAVMLARSFGGGATEARQNGASLSQQVSLGLANAATEYISEKLFGGNPIYDKTGAIKSTKDMGLVNRLINKVLTATVNEDTARRVMSVLGSTAAETLNEGWEEVVSDLLDPVWKSLIMNGDLSEVEYDLGEIAKSFISGVGLGGLGQAKNAIDVNKTGAAVMRSGQQNDLIEEALKTDNKEVFELANDLATHKKELNTHNVGQLYWAFVEAGGPKSIKPAATTTATAQTDTASASETTAETEGNSTPAERKGAEAQKTAVSDVAKAYLQSDPRMKAKTAERKADVIDRLTNGNEVTMADVKELRLRDPQSQVLFEELTGIKLPESVGQFKDEQIYTFVTQSAAQKREQKAAAEAQEAVETADAAIAAEQETLNALTTQAEADTMAEETVMIGDTEMTYDEFAQSLKYGAAQNGQTIADETIRVIFDAERAKQEETAAQENASPVIGAAGNQTAEARMPTENRTSEAENRTSEAENQTAKAQENTGAQEDAEVSDARRTGRSLGVKEEHIALAERLGKLFGRNVLFYDGETRQDASARANGYNVEGSNDIWVNVRSGNPLAQIIAHEMTHTLEKAGSYQALKDAIRERLGAEEWDSRVRGVTDLYGKNGIELNSAAAESEVVAKFVEKELLTDEETIRYMARENRTMTRRILNWLREVYAKLTGDENAQERAFIEKAMQLYSDAMQETEENEARNAEAENLQALSDVGVNYDEESESANAMSFSFSSWQESDYVKEKKKAAKELAGALGISTRKANKFIDEINSIAKIIADDRTRLDYDAAPGASSFVSNAEYGGSIDFSTICKKRRVLTGTLEAIQKEMPNGVLTADEVLRIRDMMKSRDYEVSCGLCYVDGSRAQMGKFANEFIKLFKKYHPDAEWTPNMYDVNTPTGVENMRVNHSDVYQEYNYFWNHYGTLREGDPNLFASQQKPKLFQAATEYDGEILREFRNDGTVAKKNRNGGLRLQSFSDFEIIHLIDTMQVIMDMARVKLAGQAYTKVPEFAWAVGDTGLKVNLSLIAKGVDENGRIILDEVEGMPRADAEALRNAYSKNVGTILVTFNKEQLLAALNDPFIDFIIPFHRSQWKKNYYDILGLPSKTKDFTAFQNEKLIRTTYHEYQGRKVKDKATNFMPNEYWDFSKSGKENAETYLRMCAESNKRPKFYNLLVNNGDGSYSLQPDGSTDGYWKLLIDFKMYDNRGKGSPQMPVQPKFNMERAKQMLNDYVGGHQSFPVAQDVVDEFLAERDEAPRKKFSIDENEVKDAPASFGIRKLNDYVHVQNRVYDTLKDEGFFDENGRRTVTNEESGKTVEIGRRGIFETFGKGNRFETLPRSTKDLKLATIRMLPDMIRNGEIVALDQPNEHDKNSGLTYSYIKANVQVGEKSYPVYIDIRQSPQRNLFWVHRVYTEQDQRHMASLADAKKSRSEPLVYSDNDTTNEPKVKRGIFDDVPTAAELEKRQYSVDENGARFAGQKDLTPVEERRLAREDVRYMEKNPDTFVDSNIGESVKYSFSSDAQASFEPLRDENGNILYLYKAFYAHDGDLYPPMVSNISENQKTVRKAISGTLKNLATPVGVVLTADVGALALDENGNPLRNKRGRLAVRNDKGSGTLAFRPGWHLGLWPDAKQFNRTDENGNRTLMPDSLVFAKCEIAGSIDYQLQAMALGMKKNGKYDRTQAGLPRVPVNGYYKYRTNPDPNTAPWYITGAMRVVEILDDEQCAEICAQYGVTPSPRYSGKPIRLEDYGLKRGPVTPTTDLTPYAKNARSVANDEALRTALDDEAFADAYVGREINFNDPELLKDLGINGQSADYYEQLAAKNPGYTNWRGEEGRKYSISSEAEQDEADINALRDHVADLQETLDFAELNDLSQTEVRRTQNALIKAQADLDKLIAKERRLSRATSISDLLANLDSYQRSDLESLAEQVSDSAWDDYEELSDEELRDALREVLTERSADMTELEKQVPKYGFYVRPAENRKYSISPNTPETPKMTLDDFIRQYDEKFGEGAAKAMFRDQQKLLRANKRAQEKIEQQQESLKAQKTLADQKLADQDLAWKIYTKNKLRTQSSEYRAKLDAARQEKTRAVREAVSQTEEIERAIADVRVDAANTAWEIYNKQTLRAKDQKYHARLDEARKEKNAAVAQTKEVERAVADVRVDATRMAERRNAAKRLRVKENSYAAEKQKRIENDKLRRNAAKATLWNKAKADALRSKIEKEQGLVDTIRKNPAERTAVERLQDAAVKLSTLGRSAYRNFVSQAADIERLSKRQVGGTLASTLVNVLGGSNSTTETIFKNGLVNRSGDRIGDSMKDVFLCMDERGRKVDENKQALLQDYMLHQHNIDRMSFVSRASEALDAFEAANSWLAEMDAKELAKLAATTDAEAKRLGKTEARNLAQQYVALLNNFNEARDKPVFPDSNGNPVTAKTSSEIVQKYESENPWLKDKAQGIYDWWDLFMRTWVVGDSLNLTGYETMREMYPHYVPTYRADKGTLGAANFVGMGGASVGKVVKKAKGGLSEIVNIEDSFANLAAKAVRLARVNELYKNMIDTAMLDEEGLFADMIVFDWYSDAENEAERKALRDSMTTDGYLALERAEELDLVKTKSGGYRLSAWYNGERFSAFISEDLYRSIANTTGTVANDLEINLLKVGNALTGPMKTAITGVNPAFAARNVMRDYQTAVINSISGLQFPKYLAMAQMEIVRNSERWKQFQALGGTNATQYNNEKGFAGYLESGENIASRAVEKIGSFNEVTEAMTRFAEYLATVEKLGDTYENRLLGIKNAAEVTVDFSRKGRYGKVINAWVPYWNPAIQGVDKVVRSVIDSPQGSEIWKQATKTLGRAAITTILPEAILHAVLKALGRREDWEELSDRTKDTYFCIPVGKLKAFFKLPKNREWGAILGAPFSRMLEYANGRDNPFENYIETSIEPNFLPGAILRPVDGRFESDAIGVSTALDLAYNKDFAGRTIVPYAYQQGTAAEQYDAETSRLAKELGQLIDFSPMQIDYIIEDYFGDFYSTVIRGISDSAGAGADALFASGDATAVMNGILEGSSSLWRNFRKSWIADSRLSNQTVSDYYDMVTDLEKRVYDQKNHLGDGYKDTTEYKTNAAIDKLYGKQISELNRSIRDLPDDDETRLAAKEQIALLAHDALDFYDKSMNGTIAEPLLTAEYANYSEQVSNELIRLNGMTEDYSFTPSNYTPTGYSDPKKSGYEYKLDDDQKAEYKRLYRDVYEEIMLEMMGKVKYGKASDIQKAEMLEAARDEVTEETRDRFLSWLAKNYRSTKKAK